MRNFSYVVKQAKYLSSLGLITKEQAQVGIRMAANEFRASCGFPPLGIDEDVWSFTVETEGYTGKPEYRALDYVAAEDRA